MTPYHSRSLVAAFATTMLHGGALAASPAQMTEITRLADLPAQIRADLGAGEKDAISDRGEPFNPGCVMIAGKPNQRFMLAALGADTAVVAVEHGGLFHGASSREYRLAHGKWTLVSTGMPGLTLAGQEDLLAQHARSARRALAGK